MFGTESYRTLAFIKRSRELGFALEDIRTLLELRDSHGACKDVKVIAERHLQDVQARIRDLMKLEGVLSAAVSRCPDNQSSSCPVLESLDSGCCQMA